MLQPNTIKLKLLSLILLSSVPLSGCIKTAPLDVQQRPQDWGMQISGKHNFYQISNTLYRSEQPDDQLLAELQKHQIGTVINLRSRDKDQENLGHTQLKLVHIPIHTWAMDREDLLKVMQQIQQAKNNNEKVLIHCYHGSDRTGASVAMYRIIFEHWSIEDALREMKHGGYGFHVIWQNIPKIFTPENIKWIREQLSNPSEFSPT